MGVMEFVPLGLKDKNKQHEFISWLQELPIPARRKKEVLVEWCEAMEIALTKDAVVELLGPLAEETIG